MTADVPGRAPDDPPAALLELTGWTGSWPDDDPDANFKHDVCLYALLDPLVTLRGLSRRTGIPVGSLAHYVLARWATAGSGGLMELGPEMVRRLWEPIERAEREDTDEARLAAYAKLRGVLSWLKVPLDDPSVYDLDATGRQRRAEGAS